MKSVTIFISNDYATDQRMQRIANAFIDKHWLVDIQCTKNKKTIETIDSKISIHRLVIDPEKGPFFYAKMNWVFFIQAIKSKSSYLYAVDVDTILAIRLASLIRGKKIIWDSHEIFPDMPELYSKPIVQFVWSTIEKIFAYKLKNVITVTEGVSDYLRTKLKVHPQIIHNYPKYSSQVIKPDTRSRQKVILFQGALNEGRCLRELIQAFLLLPSHFILVIAGDGHLRSNIEALVHELDLATRISFIGKILPSDLSRITQSAFIGISLLNPEHRNSYVSLANKNLDYIMAGLPCVTVDLPEYRKINDQWQVATLLQKVTPQTIADAIMDLADNEKKYIAMHHACLQAKEVLHWNNEVKKMNEFIDRL